MTASRGTTLLVHGLFVAIFFGAAWLAMWRTTPAGLAWYSGATLPVPEVTALAMRDVAVALLSLALLGLAPTWGLLWSVRPSLPRRPAKLPAVHRGAPVPEGTVPTRLAVHRRLVTSRHPAGRAEVAAATRPVMTVAAADPLQQVAPGVRPGPDDDDL